jgi:hypothetical protein
LAVAELGQLVLALQLTEQHLVFLRSVLQVVGEEEYTVLAAVVELVDREAVDRDLMAVNFLVVAESLDKETLEEPLLRPVKTATYLAVEVVVLVVLVAPVRPLAAVMVA